MHGPSGLDGRWVRAICAAICAVAAPPISGALAASSRDRDRSHRVARAPIAPPQRWLRFDHRTGRDQQRRDQHLLENGISAALIRA
jgi:hypothetical protein